MKFLDKLNGQQSLIVIFLVLIFLLFVISIFAREQNRYTIRPEPDYVVGACDYTRC